MKIIASLLSFSSIEDNRIIGSFKGWDYEKSVLREIVVNAVYVAYNQYG